MPDSLRPHGLQPIRLSCPSLSLSFLRFMSIESVMLFNHLILCLPFLPLPSVFPRIRVFPNELALLMIIKKTATRYIISNERSKIRKVRKGCKGVLLTSLSWSVYSYMGGFRSWKFVKLNSDDLCTYMFIVFVLSLLKKNL